MLCIKQIIGLALIPILLIVSAYIIPSIYKSIQTNNELNKPLRFHNLMQINIPNSLVQGRPEGHAVIFDLDIKFPHTTLTVDEPVEISGEATANPELFPKIEYAMVNFPGSQAYSSTSEPSTAFNPKNIVFFAKTQNNTSIKITWPIEGKYKSIYTIKLMNLADKIVEPHSVDIIAVHPKSETTQIMTNEVLTTLTIALYALGVFATIKIIIDLLTLP